MKIIERLLLTLVFTIILPICSFTTLARAQNPLETPIDTLASKVNKMADDISFLKKIKFSGYIQAQFQVADSMGEKSYAGGDFPESVDKRFKVRRSEFKTMYDNGKVQIVGNINISQDGITIKDAYGKWSEQRLKMFSLTAGIFNRPFGFENTHYIGSLETPERARMIQVLLPGERDCGAMISFQMPNASSFHPLKLEAGVFNGTGNAANDFDYYKDFIGNIHWLSTNKSEKLKYALGVSYYYGGVRQGTSKVYYMKADSNGIKTFVLNKDSTNSGYGAIAKRKYFGIDGQISLDFIFGITTLRAEYITGIQPGTSSSTTSPSTQPNDDTYMRKFNGACFYFIQNIFQTKHQIVVKYDWYDANMDVKGDDIGLRKFAFTNGTLIKTTNSADLKYTTLGLGYIYKVDYNLKFTLYYDKVTNEKSSNLSSVGYWKDLKDNVLTIRAQYKFQ
ncbi:MAG: porin [Bacteroidota bacterium]